MEFDLIERYFTPLSLGLPEGDLSIGDDGALITIPPEHQLVVVTDTLVSGVHFPHETRAYDIAWKALAVNLSDLAAMGASPIGFSLGLSLPKTCAESEQWMADFSQGFHDLVASTGMKIPLVGGDTTRSDILTLTVSAKGVVRKGRAVLRSGAEAGDIVAVTGVLGEGALGLALALDTLSTELKTGLSEQDQRHALNYLNRPIPQLAMGQCLYPLANSAIDISDGLLQDLGHILERSSMSTGKPLGARVELNDLPLSSGVRKLVAQEALWQMPLSGGDEYQLCLTVKPENWSALQALAAEHDVVLSRIGEITGYAGIELTLCGEGDAVPDFAGFQHF
ncbi:thiamine-phosphate kinase [Thiomicrorhabdus xiamenensis]|uniref:Thiamine-monophosphate kinase n=1 Tax=Thiomicrorhabdus xiamenensis TaxID=2739063 RepID=A0A7D4P565_9GAMM|nr:thiamine-phosphate kinase [Thiomicrorhabdus xiamenensis]QKI89415.1 thiamine-phosphate kinase [Thiomicrorhabdus xiamenensis]